ncbi:flotillin-like FloA family protein [Pontibacter pamirensis]|uniref:flotillin-like FloA family protein n=1 Tax=Pontibacter pamirensis TaxID=2562824 RepID=UPI001389EFD3|nr:hypothetical protein [Pontibacter pamirensis]
MNTDFILLVLILLTFFGGGLWLVKQFPIYFAKYRAKSFGLELTKDEALIVQNGFCIKKDFLVGAKGILDLKQVQIEKLVNHYLAGGNLENVRRGILELQKRQKDVDFATLSAIDLAGKDLKYEIKNSDIESSIEIKDLSNGKITIRYRANYKYVFPNSVWIEDLNENLAPKIKNKLSMFLSSWEETDVFKTESFIRQNILPISFWESELEGVLVGQKIEIRKTGGNTAQA